MAPHHSAATEGDVLASGNDNQVLLQAAVLHAERRALTGHLGKSVVHRAGGKTETQRGKGLAPCDTASRQRR